MPGMKEKVVEFKDSANSEIREKLAKLEQEKAKLLIEASQINDKIESLKLDNKKLESELEKEKSQVSKIAKSSENKKTELKELEDGFNNIKAWLKNNHPTNLLYNLKRSAIAVVNNTKLSNKDKNAYIKDINLLVELTTETSISINKIARFCKGHNPQKTAESFREYSEYYDIYEHYLKCKHFIEIDFVPRKAKLNNEIVDIAAKYNTVSKKFKEEEIRINKVINDNNEKISILEEDLSQIQCSLEELSETQSEIDKLLVKIKENSEANEETKQKNINDLRELKFLTDQGETGYSLEIHQLDVGQGESALIICRDDKNEIEWSVLLDVGKAENDNDEHIAQFLTNHLGGLKLDAVIISHQDLDHHGNLVNSLIENNNWNPIENFIEFDEDETRTLFITQDSRFTLSNAEVGEKREVEDIDESLILNKTIWELLDKEMPKEKVPNITCIADNARVKSKKGMKILDKFLSSNEEDSKNERSLGFLIEFGGFTFYTGGDLPSMIEDQIDIGKVSAFKAGHHGSKFSTSASLISRLKPRAAVISHGNRSFGDECHPNIIVLDNIIDDDNVQLAYLTNPTPSESDKQNKLKENQKFIIAGRDRLLSSTNRGKSPRGDVSFKVTHYQSEAKDCFFVNYRQNYDIAKSHPKDKFAIDHFTNTPKSNFPKITEDNIISNLSIESPSRIEITDIEEKGGNINANLKNKFSDQEQKIEISGKYRKKDDEYETPSGKVRVTSFDQLVLKSSDISFEESRRFVKSLDHQAYEELIQSIPEKEKDKIEQNDGRIGKLKIKANNETRTTVSLSWIEKVEGRNNKHKIKVKTIISPQEAEEKRFVNRVSYSTSNKTR